MEADDIETPQGETDDIKSPPNGKKFEKTLSFVDAYKTPVRQTKEYPLAQSLILAYQSLGVVYGDIGTSPLYVFSSITLSEPGEKDILGIMSLIFWTLTLIGLIKYVFIVLRADDHVKNTRLASDSNLTFYGNGKSLQSKTKKFFEESLKAQSILTFSVLLGTCMVIGDGALTPAISVLSAVQGIQSRSPKIEQKHVVLMSVVILLLLFLFQRFGTSKVSFSFSPIMLLWFSSTASIGVYNIIKFYPTIFKALSPHYIYYLFARNHKTGWELLGAIALCITGAEAMFADLGHFNKRGIQLAFSTLVYPALLLTYAGEAAYLIKNPENISTTFYSSVPSPIFWPMFVIATLAAIVASRALISGGVQIGNAYGVAVIWVMLITTCLMIVVMLVIWSTNIVLTSIFFFIFLTVEGVYMSSLLNKVPQGGWVPFAISIFFLVITLSWTYGRTKKNDYEAERKLSKSDLHELISSSEISRVPGICFFCTDLVNGIPPIIRHYMQHVGSLRKIMVIVTVRTLPVRSVLPEERFQVGKLGSQGVYRCLV